MSQSHSGGTHRLNSQQVQLNTTSASCGSASVSLLCKLSNQGTFSASALVVSQLTVTVLHLRPLHLLDPDLEAETVEGVALGRLTGAGTVPLDTLRENTSDGSPGRKTSSLRRFIHTLCVKHKLLQHTEASCLPVTSPVSCD